MRMTSLNMHKNAAEMWQPRRVFLASRHLHPVLSLWLWNRGSSRYSPRNKEVGVWIIEKYRAEAGKGKHIEVKTVQVPSLLSRTTEAETVETRISFPALTTVSVHHGRTSQFAPGAPHVRLHAQTLADLG